MEQFNDPITKTKDSLSQNVFMYPQFLIDNLFSKYKFKSYQLLNSSSKEFKSIESIVNSKLSIMEQRNIKKYYLLDEGLTMKKVVVDNKTIYFVFGISLNDENIDFSNEHYSYIESYFDKNYDPIINIMNKTMIVFGDVLKEILINPRVIYTDDLSRLDPDIVKSIESRYLDLITLNTRPFEDIFKFIYNQQFNNIISKDDYIVNYYQFDILIYNIYYLALNKIFKNSSNIILAKDSEVVMKNIIASIYTLDNINRLKYINIQDNPLNDLMIELNKYVLSMKPATFAEKKFKFCEVTSDPLFVNSNPINQMNIILETEKEF